MLYKIELLSKEEGRWIATNQQVRTDVFYANGALTNVIEQFWLLSDLGGPGLVYWMIKDLAMGYVA